jgi:hypothetical protein
MRTNVSSGSNERFCLADDRRGAGSGGGATTVVGGVTGFISNAFTRDSVWSSPRPKWGEAECASARISELFQKLQTRRCVTEGTEAINRKKKMSNRATERRDVGSMIS